jgi:lysyl-tRNA synthetase class 2
MEQLWKPTASIATLEVRASMLRAARDYFTATQALEVETPTLSAAATTDVHLGSVEARCGATKEQRFLHTSPEYPMKRLLASGCGDIWQICRVYRDGESGRWHNPEFTLIEWYRPGDTHVEQMAFTERYVREFWRAAARLRSAECGVRCAECGMDEEFERLTYDEAFERYAGTRVLRLPVAALADLAASHGIVVPPGLAPEASARDEWLNLLLAELVEPHLGVERPTFLYDYPASQAALAVVRREGPPIAERFELYVGGVELCNGYHELLDAGELRRRNREQNAKRATLGMRRLPEESRLLAAMEHGLPGCSGVALGFDRLVMVALGKRSLGEVRTFLTENGRTGERENREGD